MTVEALAILQVAEVVNEHTREGGPLGAEEVVVQRLILGRNAGPPCNISRPMQFDERPKHRAEDREPVGNAVEEPNPINGHSPQLAQ